MFDFLKSKLKNKGLLKSAKEEDLKDALAKAKARAASDSNTPAAFTISKPQSFRTERYNYDDKGKIKDYEKNIGFDKGKGKKDVDITKNVDSTAIASARYDPSDDSLNITYTTGPKEYKFKAGGKEGIDEWVKAPSKGRITQAWKQSHRMPGY